MEKPLSTPPPSLEETDNFQRSNKKYKRKSLTEPPLSLGAGGSYRTILQGGNTNNVFMQKNPIFSPAEEDDDEVSDDDIPPSDEEEDPQCPTILLSKEEKKRLRRPWRNTLLIKMFDKNMGYFTLVRKLQQRWALKGQFSLIDVGHDYYVVRFANMEDYNFVLTEGPWLINDHYLTIRKWVHDFVPDSAPPRFLTAWVTENPSAVGGCSCKSSFMVR